VLPIISQVIPECTATNRVDNDEKHEEYDIHCCDLLPVGLKALQEPSLASLAIETQNIGIIVPSITVRVGIICTFNLVPDRWTLVLKVAAVWWLATPGLNHKQHVQNHESESFWSHAKNICRNKKSEISDGKETERERSGERRVEVP